MTPNLSNQIHNLWRLAAAAYRAGDLYRENRLVIEAMKLEEAERHGRAIRTAHEAAAQAGEVKS